MKNFKISLFFMSLLGILFLMSSCELEDPDPCEGVTCQNGGTCLEGTCDCPIGFSGTNCETEDVCLTGNLVCANGGSCVDGTCECVVGYEGMDCSTLSRDKYIGTYTGEAVCSDGNNPLSDVSIEAHSDDTKFLLNMTDDQSSIPVTYELTITGSNTFDLPTQMACSGCLSEEGGGSIDENGVVTVNSTIGGNITCTFTLTPQ